MHTILVVDDEPTILMLARFTLNRGYRVLTASGGVEGLAILAVNPVDLVISDLRMPGMSGLEFLRAVREGYPRAARMLVTAYPNHEDVRQAIAEVGIHRLLAKPWQPDELLAAVRDAF